MHVLADGNAGSAIGGVAIWLVVIAAYWVPTIVAAIRHVPNAGSVAVIDGLLGWTVVGWIIALAMACRSRPANMPRHRTPDVPQNMTGYR